MATLTIRDFDDDLKAVLRVRAAEQAGRWKRRYARSCVLCWSGRRATVGWGRESGQRFHGEDVELELPARTERPRAAELDG